jgi:glucose-6-phosphate 1-dehydrogenase
MREIDVLPPIVFQHLFRSPILRGMGATRPLRLLVFGGLGDMASRHLLPGLARLEAAHPSPRALPVTAIDRWEITSDGYRELASVALGRFAPAVPEVVRGSVLHDARYVCADLSRAPDLSEVLGGDTVLAYLALPPDVQAAAVEALARGGLRPDSIVVVEKPFGHDRLSARRLDELLRGVVAEDRIFRADHFLYNGVARDILAARRSARLAALWSHAHVERVDLVWEESSGVGARAAFYDSVGALADMVQSHLLQLLALVAMEPQATRDGADLQRAKADVLRRVRALSRAQVVTSTARGRYSTGRVNGTLIPAYVDEEGVDPTRQTATYAHLELRVDTRRWQRVPFVIRTGKAVADAHRHVSISFRGGNGEGPLVLRFREDGVTYGALRSIDPDPHAPPHPPPHPPRQSPELPPSALLLRDVLAGDWTRSVSAAEIDQCWRIVDGVAAEWRSGNPPLREYAAGSTGPFPEAAAGYRSEGETRPCSRANTSEAT